MIMWAAPIGAFGAIAAVVGETGWTALAALGQIMLGFYITCFLFVVLVLGSYGLVQRFSVASGSWTETAPLARFRLARGRLYRLRTTPAGAFVDRFDLEVPR